MRLVYPEIALGKMQLNCQPGKGRYINSAAGKVVIATEDMTFGTEGRGDNGGK